MAERDGRLVLKICWEEWNDDCCSGPTKNIGDENYETDSDGEGHEEASRLLKPTRRSKSGGKAGAGNGKQGPDSEQEPEDIPVVHALKVIDKGVRRESMTLARDYKRYSGPKTKELDSMIAAHVLALRRLAWASSQDRA